MAQVLRTRMDYYPFLEQLIISAGALSLQYRKNLAALDIRRKNDTVRDLVSEADRAVELFIRQRIREQFPKDSGHKIIGEELGAEQPGAEDYCWVIDPIDGTINFLKGFGYYSLSIALQQDGVSLCGAVYAPVSGRLYSAKRGGGQLLPSVVASGAPQLRV